MARRQLGRSWFSRSQVFADLPVGTCFAFSSQAVQATRRKVDARRVLVVPRGKRPLVVEDVEVAVHPKPCAMPGVGRRRRRRKGK